MSQGRIFADDWRACLREQYKYVIRQQDSRTEATLTDALYEVGFSEEELAALRLEATMRDMPDDYVPDEVQAIYAGVAVPDAEPVTEAMVETVIEDVGGDTLEVEDELEEELPPTYDELVEQAEEAPVDADEDEEERADDSPDSAQQLSLF